MAHSPVKHFRFLAACRTTTSPTVGYIILSNAVTDDYLIMEEQEIFSVIPHVSEETETPILSRNRNLLQNLSYDFTGTGPLVFTYQGFGNNTMC